MELRQLRYFCAVAEAKHLGRAAERLGLSSPSVSQQIRALERELGARLFDRVAAGMSLTAAGEALLPEALLALAAAKRAARVVRESASVVRTCTVGVPAGVPPGLPRRLREAATGVRLVFETLSSAEQLVRLHRGELDCCILTLPAETAELATAIVHDEPLGVLLAAGHPLAVRDEIGWADLGGQQLLWFRRDLAPGYHDALLAACHSGGWRPALRGAAARRAVTLAELTGADPIVALRPASDIERGLTWRPLAAAPPRLRLALAWPRDRRHPVLPAIASDLAC